VLGEDQVTVEADIEDATASLDQFGSFAEQSLNFVRQTGGSRTVVSNDAVFNCDRHNAGKYIAVLVVDSSNSACGRWRPPTPKGD
jgi:hypothetical protein